MAIACSKINVTPQKVGNFDVASGFGNLERRAIRSVLGDTVSTMMHEYANHCLVPVHSSSMDGRRSCAIVLVYVRICMVTKQHASHSRVIVVCGEMKCCATICI